MKKNLLALVAFSGILFTSCSNEMDQMVEQQNEKNAIGFSTYSMMSKGTPITGNRPSIPEGGLWQDPSNFLCQGRRFHVAAYINDATNQYMNAGIKFEGGTLGYGWHYINQLDKAYWPTKGELLNFYAAHPYADFYHPTESSRKGTISYENANKQMTINYTVPNEIQNQEDLMYACQLRQQKPETGSAVQLNFKHALNQINFMGRTDSKNLYVEIAPNGIQVCNIKSSGTLTVTEKSASWIAAEKTKVNYSIATINSGNVTINTQPSLPNGSGPGGNPTFITNSSNVLMLIPQAVTAWDRTTNASGQANSYLKINCKIWVKTGDLDSDRVYLHGSAPTAEPVSDGYAFMYVPFAGTGMDQTGKKITYTLIFGGGYTDEGQPILTPITFDTAVTDWGFVSIPDINA